MFLGLFNRMTKRKRAAAAAAERRRQELVAEYAELQRRPRPEVVPKKGAARAVGEPPPYTSHLHGGYDADPIAYPTYGGSSGHSPFEAGGGSFGGGGASASWGDSSSSGSGDSGSSSSGGGSD